MSEKELQLEKCNNNNMKKFFFLFLKFSCLLSSSQGDTLIRLRNLRRTANKKLIICEIVFYGK